MVRLRASRTLDWAFTCPTPRLLCRRRKQDCGISKVRDGSTLRAPSDTMRDGPCFDRLFLRLLLVALILGFANIALRFNVGGVRDFLGRTQTAGPSEQGTVSPVPVQHQASSRRAGPPQPVAALKVTQRRESRRPRSVPGPLERPVSRPTPSPAAVIAQSAAPPEPDRKVLKPLGFVQKAHGAVEAIVSEGDSVHLVHVGDVYEEKFTVAKISPEAVEMVAALTPPSTSSTALASAFRADLATSAYPETPTFALQPPRVQAALRPVALGAAANQRARRIEERKPRLPGLESQAPVQEARRGHEVLPNRVSDSPNPLGYVQKADGTRYAVVPEGESVSLVPQTSPMAGPAEPKMPLAASAMPQDPLPWKSPPVVANLNRTNKLPALWSYGAQSVQHLAMPLAESSTSKQKGFATSQQAGVIEDPRPIPWKALGFIERADGEVEAIFDGDEEVHLVKVREGSRGPLVASDDSVKTAEGTDRFSIRSSQPKVLLASFRPRNGLPSRLPWKVSRPSPPWPVPEGKPWRGMEWSGPGPPGLWESPGRAPPPGPSTGHNRLNPAVPLENTPTPGCPIPGTPAGVASEGRRSVLKSLGYAEWQDGRLLSVVDGGDDSVCLLQEGENLDSGFRVVKVYQKEVEIAELPIVESASATPSPEPFAWASNSPLPQALGELAQVEGPAFLERRDHLPGERNPNGPLIKGRPSRAALTAPSPPEVMASTPSDDAGRPTEPSPASTARPKAESTRRGRRESACCPGLGVPRL